MALENTALEQELREKPELQIVAGMIDPQKGFDRDYFASHLFNYHDNFEKWENKLNKNADDPYTISKVSGGLFGDKGLILRQPNPQLFAKDAIYQYNDQFKKTLGFYVANNEDEFFKRNDGQSLLQILLSENTVLVKDDDEEYNKAIKAINGLREIQAISQDQGKIKSYVDEKLKHAPRWLKRVYGSFGYTPEFHQQFFQAYAGVAQQKAFAEFMDEKENVNKKKIEKILKHSLNIAWKAYKKEEAETNGKGDQEDIYEKSMMPIYLSLAEGIFQTEYREHEKRTNYQKMQREAEREKQGIKS